jgi:hypothetical protein
MKKIILFLSLFSAVFYSCEQKAPAEKTPSDSSSVNAVNLVQELSVLQDSMSFLLTEIHELDTAKFAQQERLLMMISHMSSPVSKAEIKSAEELLKNLNEYPGMEVMIKAQTILYSYDADSDSLLNITNRMLAKVKKSDPLHELEISITEKDNRSVVLRFNYDEIAKRYNLILEKNQEILMKSDSTKFGKTVPLFQAENPS